MEVGGEEIRIDVYACRTLADDRIFFNLRPFRPGSPRYEPRLIYTVFNHERDTVVFFLNFFYTSIRIYAVSDTEHTGAAYLVRPIERVTNHRVTHSFRHAFRSHGNTVVYASRTTTLVVNAVSTRRYFLISTATYVVLKCLCTLLRLVELMEICIRRNPVPVYNALVFNG